MDALTPVVLAGLMVLGIGAGWLGALVGIGGGVIVVPTLVIAFGVDIRSAVAASLVAVIATSTAAGSVYVADGVANLRLGMTLEVATTVGGLSGGLAAVLVPSEFLAAALGVLLGVTALLMVRRPERYDEGSPAEARQGPEGWEETGRLAGAFLDARTGVLVRYRAERVGLGSALSLLAGAVSGMLGVGGGFLKVPAMHLVMRVPMKVAAATSNFMIGVTAAASLIVYLAAGFVRPLLVGPLVLGVVLGSLVGTTTAGRASPRLLRWLLAGILAVVAAELLARAGGIRVP